jgi:hypothetical protein
MKYIIEITQVDVCPQEWQKKESWPSIGLYQVKDETYALYQVYQHGVQYISYPDAFTVTPYMERGEAVNHCCSKQLPQQLKQRYWHEKPNQQFHSLP